MSNLDPLPTNFQLPGSCVEEMTSIYVKTMPPGGYFLQGPAEQTTCYPGMYQALDLGLEYYSPGRCPTGFTPACSSSIQINQLTETVVTCCPTHHSFLCQLASKYQWQSTLGCNAAITAFGVWTVHSYSDGIDNIQTTSLSTGGFNAYSIQVRYQSTDFVSSTSSVSTSTQLTPTSLSTSSLLPTTTNGDTSGNNTSSKSSSEISAGQIAGIAIGAFAGLLLLIAGVWYQITHNRRQRQAIQSLSAAQQQQHGYPPDARASQSFWQGGEYPAPLQSMSQQPIFRSHGLPNELEGI
ncbi:hypothetical protein F5Y12DRAFT_787532 [Xylaria sp. FL1777]|nr:hypothetical protein F5Y12DRAFT_787532 [Xylaria sp. FL1777]